MSNFKDGCKSRFAIAIQKSDTDFEHITSPAAGYAALITYVGYTSSHVILKFDNTQNEVIWRWSVEKSMWVVEQQYSTGAIDVC